MADILQLIVDSIAVANQWFQSMLDSTGMAPVLVGFICIFLSARFILMPIVGGAFFRATSDRVKKSNIGNKEDN